jgi:hypothetical protein
MRKILPATTVKGLVFLMTILRGRPRRGFYFNIAPGVELFQAPVVSMGMA